MQYAGDSMTTHQKWMQHAIALATENVRSRNGGPFGAVITRGEDLIATGVNLVTATNDSTAHAEVVAIRNACTALAQFQLQGCTLYTSCEPCPMCLAACYWAHLDAVYYGNTSADAAAAGFDDASLYRELALPTTDRKLAMYPLLRDEAQDSFRVWQASDLEIDY
jgi:guanine deaminase